MAKRLKLDTVYDDEVSIVGISCHKPDYWIALRINKALHFNLVHLPSDITISSIEGASPRSFPVFFSSSDETMISYFLIPNHSQEGRLFPDQKIMDYFMVVKGRIRQDDLNGLISLIKKIPNVLTAQNLNRKNIKNIDEFLGELEVFMLELKSRKKKSD